MIISKRVPNEYTNPPTIPYMWTNSTTGEVFICIDNTKDRNVWVGQTQTSIGDFGKSPDEFSELAAWWKAEDLSLADRAVVSSWPDATSNFTMTDSDSSVVGPTFLENQRNGFPGVKFMGYDGSVSKGIGLTAGSDYLFSDNTKSGLTLFAVASTFAVIGDGNLFSEGAVWDHCFSLGATSNSIVGICSDDPALGGGGGGDAIAVISDNPKLFVVVIEFDVAIRTYCDGVLYGDRSITLSQLTSTEVSTASTRGSSSGPLSIGVQSKNNNTDDDRSFYGTVFEIGAYRSALSEQDVADLYLHYQNKYLLGGSI